MNLETEIYQILRKHRLSLKKREEVIVDLLDFIKKRDEAMNYSQCCTELKDKEAKTFQEYVKLQGYTRISDSNVYKKEKGVYKDVEVFKKEYNKYLNL